MVTTRGGHHGVNALKHVVMVFQAELVNVLIQHPTSVERHARSREWDLVNRLRGATSKIAKVTVRLGVRVKVAR